MLIGSFGALNQSLLKRLFAYSAISHIGYLLISFLTLNPSAILFYMLVYMVMSLHTFSFIMALQPSKESLADLVGLAKTEPILSFSFVLTLLSFAGIPPLAGFLSKYVVFMSAVTTGYTLLAVLGILTSVVAAIYYIRAFQLIYFYPKSTL